MLWDYTSYSGTNTTIYVQKDLNRLIPGYSTTNTPPWHITSAAGVNDAGVIVANGIYSGTNSAIAHGPHGLVLLPCQLRLLNGDTNAADYDGAFIDEHRPTTYTDPDISTDNSLTSDDIIDVGPNLGPVNPSVGTGTYANSYVFNLLVIAQVNHIPGATYACTRTFQERVWALQWDGSFWNVRQFRLGDTGFPTPVGDGSGTDGLGPLGPSDNSTTNVSPKGVLYYDDSPGIKCEDADDEINVGDCVYEECDFTYTLTVTIGTKSEQETFHIGEILKLTKVNNYGDDPRDFDDPTKNYIIVSSTNIPSCYMTAAKASGILGTTTSNIRLNTNINDGD